MKFDCPHCGRDIKLRSPRFEDIFSRIGRFDCPHCGKPVALRWHAEEVLAVVALFLSVVLPAQHLAVNVRGIPAWAIVVMIVLSMALVIGALVYSVRNKQRYKK